MAALPPLSRMLKRAITRVRERAAGLSTRLDVAWPCDDLGTAYGHHAVLTSRLGPGSVVYSFGLGLDISFDLELIARSGARLWGFDPTPRSIAFVKAQALPPEFTLCEYGVAGHDGIVSFAAPDNPEHISHSVVARKGATMIDFPVKRLSTIMAALGHTRLDVLKLDVEGAEYDVLDEVLAQRMDIDQLLVEFHHQFATIPARRTADALQRMRAAGYRVFHVADNLREFSLARG